MTGRYSRVYSILKLQTLRKCAQWATRYMEMLGNGPNGLSGTMETLAGSIRGYFLLRGRVQPSEKLIAHGCPYAATVP
jgi:hypothetical protein